MSLLRYDRFPNHSASRYRGTSAADAVWLGASGDRRAPRCETGGREVEGPASLGAMNRIDTALLAALTVLPLAGSIYASETDLRVAALPLPPKMPREWDGSKVVEPELPARWSMYEGPEELRTNIAWLGDLSALTTRK